MKTSTMLYLICLVGALLAIMHLYGEPLSVRLERQRQATEREKRAEAERRQAVIEACRGWTRAWSNYRPPGWRDLFQGERARAPETCQKPDFWHNEASWVFMKFSEKTEAARLMFNAYRCQCDTAARRVIRIRGLHNGRTLATYSEEKGLRNY